MSDALDVLVGLRLEGGRTWGEAATPVQRRDAEAILDDDAPGRSHFISRSRGYAKTTHHAAVTVPVLLTQAPAGARCYALAADQAQARLLLDSIEGFVRRTPGLSALLDVQTWKVSVRASGASVEALAADASGAWGLRPYFAVCDELCEWAETRGPKTIFDAITSAMPKTNGRLVIITTAGSPSHWARKIRDHAEQDPRWRLSETSGPPPWMSPELIEEQRARLLPSMFARLFKNEWTASEDRLVDPDDLAACVVLDGPLPPQRGKTYKIGLDVGVRHDRTVAAVCHGEIVGDPGQPVGVRVVVDRLQVWAGQGREREVQLDEVAEWLAWASSSYGRAEVIFDPSQAILLAQQLRKRGVVMREFTFHPRSVSQLALTLHGLIRSRRLALPDDEDLVAELGSVTLRETSPGTFRVDHDPDKHDDRAIALALAAYRIVERGAPTAARSYVSRRRLPVRTGFALAGRDVQDTELRGLAAALGLPFNGGSP
jgi:hypothetical protein